MFIEFALVAGIVSSFFTPATSLAIEESALVAPKNVSQWEISQDRTLPWTPEELLRQEGLSGKELEMALATISLKNKKFLRQLIKCESGGKIFALNPKDLDGSPSYGILQFKPKTLYKYVVKYNLLPDITLKEITNLLYDWELQVRTTVKMLEDSSVNLAMEFPDCFRRYGYLLN